MKLFVLDQNLRHSDYAWFAHLGTWSDGEVCPTCTSSSSVAIEPALVQWEPGRVEVGDFAWCLYSVIAVDRVRDFLMEAGFECKFGKVEMARPDRPKAKNVVPWPYEGPHFSWLIPTAQVRIDEKASDLRLKYDCKTCGRRRYVFKMDGLVVDAADWKGENMFMLEQYTDSGAIYVPEPAMDLLLSQGFTNLQYREAGEIR